MGNYDPSKVMMWIEQDSSIHLKIAEPTHGDPVELTAEEARAIASDLFELSIRLDNLDGCQDDWFSIPMQVITIKVTTSEKTDKSNPVAGAYVNCWIKNQTSKNAKILAFALVAQQGWECLDIVEQRTVCLDDYSGDPENLPYYEQALIDGEVLVFHTYPQKDE